eukprot:Rmarinus@m.29473
MDICLFLLFLFGSCFQFICALNFRSVEVNSTSLTLTYEYHEIPEQETYVPDVEFAFCINIRSSMDAHIVLASSSMDSAANYEIILGAYSNTAIVIRDEIGGTDSSIISGTFLSDSEKRPFWLARFLNSTIAIGEGCLYAHEIVISYQDTLTPEENNTYVGVSAGVSSQGAYWSLFEHLELDECELFTHNCPSISTCTDTYDSFTCTCVSGYIGDGLDCSDLTECANGVHNCHTDALCSNTVGSFSCSCRKGYEGTGVECEDKDECVSGSHLCDPNALCTNSQGGYECACLANYFGDGWSCEPCADHATSEGSGSSCVCDSGYEGDGAVVCEKLPLSCSHLYNTNSSLSSGFYTIAPSSDLPATTVYCYMDDSVGGWTVVLRRAADTISFNRSFSEYESGFFDDDGNGFLGLSYIHALSGAGDMQMRLNWTTTSNSTNFVSYESFTVGSASSSYAISASGFDGQSDYFSYHNGLLFSAWDVDNDWSEGSCAQTHGGGWWYHNCFDVLLSGSYDANQGFALYSRAGSAYTSLSGAVMMMGGNVNATKFTWITLTVTCDAYPKEASWNLRSPSGEYYFEHNQLFEHGEETRVYSLLLESGEWVLLRYDVAKDGGISADVSETAGLLASFDSSYSVSPATDEFYVELNPCVTGVHNCNSLSTCSDTVGSFSCSCPAGYWGDGVSCTACASNATSSAGSTTSSECLCVEGYYGVGHEACVWCGIGATSLTGSTEAAGCLCVSGYEGNGTDCQEVDECSVLTHDCSILATCEDSIGSFSCTCNAGYIGNGTNCEDVSECEEAVHTCAGVGVTGCVNTYGSFECICSGGFVFTSSESGCSDEDECLLFVHDCDEEADCVNVEGSFECTCVDGFEGDGVSCEDSNECVAGTHTCATSVASCANSHGSYSCACNTGFTGDGIVCEDVFECSDGLHNCNERASCTNTEGSFWCLCDAGMTGDGVECQDVDECALLTHDCAGSVSCLNTEGSFMCGCGAGYELGDAGCEDIDECGRFLDDCLEPQSCENTMGSFTCPCPEGSYGIGSFCYECTDGASSPAGSTSISECYCLSGYEGSAEFSCQDINECGIGTHDCSQFAACVNIAGSFTCTCGFDFYGNGTRCDACATNAQSSVDGGTCMCNSGYFGDGVSVCTQCGTYAISEVGSESASDCYCSDGYVGEGHVQCVDVNECSTSKHTCDLDSMSCFNTVGSFGCICTEGYWGDGISCTSCATNAWSPAGSLEPSLCYCVENFFGNGSSDCISCALNAESQSGSVRPENCTCKQGYFGDGASLCEDEDECLLGVHTCDVTATCSNSDGSFSCSCGIGYSGSGVYCENTNECETAVHTCSQDATCVDSVGSFTCLCFDGFTGDGGTCSDNDECAQGTDNCADIGSLCTNVAGSFQCGCNEGYTGNGVSCADLNECTFGFDDCYSTAVCENTVGSFSCYCDSGYYGNGVLCQPCAEFATSPTASNSSSACFCQEGYYGDGATVCVACATSATSPEGSTDAAACVCTAGYGGDGAENCDDLNECALGAHTCTSEASCTNVAGSFVCGCVQGYWGDGLTCTPCSSFATSLAGSLSSEDCSCNEGYFGDGVECSECHNLAGSESGSTDASDCVCNEGYSGDGVNSCEDMDECILGTNTCHSLGICNNTVGSFSCSCGRDYWGDGSVCTTCAANAQAEPGSTSQVECLCNAGYYGKGFSECFVCADEATAPLGSIYASACECLEGFEGLGYVSCGDVDECQNGAHDCAPSAECTNTHGSFACSCAESSWGDGLQCTQCADNAYSPANSTAASACVCSAGFYGIGATECAACLIGTYAAVNATECVSCAEHATSDTHECWCSDGFSGDAYVECTDIDECSLGVNDCSASASCTNTEGSFTCECNANFWGNGVVCSACAVDAISPPGSTTSSACLCDAGFAGDGSTSCEVCPSGTWAGTGSMECTSCAEHALSETGSTDATACSCNVGYYGNGGVACEECPAGSTTSAAGGNVLDSCLCSKGFTGSAHVGCTECAAGTYKNTLGNSSCTACPEGSTSALGSDRLFDCECNTGYFGVTTWEGGEAVGFSCADVTECVDAIHDCSDRATCENTAGSFACSCNTGFGGSGVECEDLDECLLGTHDCPASSWCINTEGSFTCPCDQDHYLDVEVCVSCAANAGAPAGSVGGDACSCNEGFTGVGSVICQMTVLYLDEKIVSATEDMLYRLSITPASGWATDYLESIQRVSISGTPVGMSFSSLGGTKSEIAGGIYTLTSEAERGFLSNPLSAAMSISAPVQCDTDFSLELGVPGEFHFETEDGAIQMDGTSWGIQPVFLQVAANADGGSVTAVPSLSSFDDVAIPFAVTPLFDADTDRSEVISNLVVRNIGGLLWSSGSVVQAAEEGVVTLSPTNGAFSPDMRIEHLSISPPDTVYADFALSIREFVTDVDVVVVESDNGDVSGIFESYASTTVVLYPNFESVALEVYGDGTRFYTEPVNITLECLSCYDNVTQLFTTWSVIDPSPDTLSDAVWDILSEATAEDSMSVYLPAPVVLSADTVELGVKVCQNGESYAEEICQNVLISLPFVSCVDASISPLPYNNQLWTNQAYSFDIESSSHCGDWGIDTSFSWEVIGEGVSISSSTSHLDVPADTFQKYESYTFTATVCTLETFEDCVSDTQVLYVGAENIVAVIQGGSGIHSATEPLSLDGSSSFDPEGEALTYAWSCTVEYLDGSVEGCIFSADGSVLNLGVPSVGVYEVTLVVQTEDGRTAWDSVSIDVQDVEFPMISLSLRIPKNQYPSSDVIIIDAQVYDATGVSWFADTTMQLLWDVSYEESTKQVSLGEQTSASLVIPPNTLEVGTSYVIRLSAIDGSVSAVRELTLKTAPGILRGEGYVSPSEGYALESLFNLQAFGYQNIDGSSDLEYRFFAMSGGTTVYLSTWQTATDLATTLPPGDLVDNGRLDLYVDVKTHAGYVFSDFVAGVNVTLSDDAIDSPSSYITSFVENQEALAEVSGSADRFFSATVQASNLFESVADAMNEGEVEATSIFVLEKAHEALDWIEDRDGLMGRYQSWGAEVLDTIMQLSWDIILSEEVSTLSERMVHRLVEEGNRATSSADESVLDALTVGTCVATLDRLWYSAMIRERYEVSTAVRTLAAALARASSIDMITGDPEQCLTASDANGLRIAVRVDSSEMALYRSFETSAGEAVVLSECWDSAGFHVPVEAWAAMEGHSVLSVVTMTPTVDGLYLGESVVSEVIEVDFYTRESFNRIAVPVLDSPLVFEFVLTDTPASAEAITCVFYDDVVDRFIGDGCVTLPNPRPVDSSFTWRDGFDYASEPSVHAAWTLDLDDFPGCSEEWVVQGDGSTLRSYTQAHPSTVCPLIDSNCFWDMGHQAFRGDGCVAVDDVECRCNHLSIFSVVSASLDAYEAPATESLTTENYYTVPLLITLVVALACSVVVAIAILRRHLWRKTFWTKVYTQRYGLIRFEHSGKSIATWTLAGVLDKHTASDAGIQLCKLVAIPPDRLSFALPAKITFSGSREAATHVTTIEEFGEAAADVIARSVDSPAGKEMGCTRDWAASAVELANRGDRFYGTAFVLAYASVHGMAAANAIDEMISDAHTLFTDAHGYLHNYDSAASPTPAPSSAAISSNSGFPGGHKIDGDSALGGDGVTLDFRLFVEQLKALVCDGMLSADWKLRCRLWKLGCLQSAAGFWCFSDDLLHSIGIPPGTILTLLGKPPSHAEQVATVGYSSAEAEKFAFAQLSLKGVAGSIRELADLKASSESDHGGHSKAGPVPMVVSHKATVDGGDMAVSKENLPRPLKQTRQQLAAGLVRTKFDILLRTLPNPLYALLSDQHGLNGIRLRTLWATALAVAFLEQVRERYYVQLRPVPILLQEHGRMWMMRCCGFEYIVDKTVSSASLVVAHYLRQPPPRLRSRRSIWDACTAPVRMFFHWARAGVTKVLDSPERAGILLCKMVTATSCCVCLFTLRSIACCDSFVHAVCDDDPVFNDVCLDDAVYDDLCTMASSDRAPYCMRAYEDCETLQCSEFPDDTASGKLLAILISYLTTIPIGLVLERLFARLHAYGAPGRLRCQATLWDFFAAMVVSLLPSERRRFRRQIFVSETLTVSADIRDVAHVHGSRSASDKPVAHVLLQAWSVCVGYAMVVSLTAAVSIATVTKENLLENDMHNMVFTLLLATVVSIAATFTRVMLVRLLQSSASRLAGDAGGDKSWLERTPEEAHYAWQS